jgi:hypothetical protein
MSNTKTTTKRTNKPLQPLSSLPIQYSSKHKLHQAKNSSNTHSIKQTTIQTNKLHQTKTNAKSQHQTQQPITNNLAGRLQEAKAVFGAERFAVEKRANKSLFVFGGVCLVEPFGRGVGHANKHAVTRRVDYCELHNTARKAKRTKRNAS